MAALPGSGYLWRSSALSEQDQQTMVYLLPSSLLQRIFPQLAAAPAESSTTTTSASFRPLTTTTPGSGSSSRSASPASGYGSKTRRSSTDSQLTLWPSSDDHSSKWMPEDPFLEEQRTPRSTSSRRDWRELWRWANSVLRAAIVLMAIHGVWMQAAWHRGSYMPTPHYTRNDIAQAGFIRQPLEFGKLPSGNAVSKETRRTQTSVHDFADLSTAPRTPDEQHVLILSPLRNAEPTLSAFLELLATLEHPRAQTSLGLLIGDEEDATGSLIADWVKEQAEKGEYRHISLIRKDFGLDSPKGNARHLKWVQPQRRSLMAKARTLLLTSTLRPDVDWVLWLDSDLAFAPPSLVSDLLRYGGAGVGGPDPEDTAGTMATHGNRDRLPADVIVPNVMKHHKGPSSVQAYDWNSWTETRKSIAMRSKLDPEQILAEGDPSMPTYRTHLVHEWTRPNVSASWDATSPLFPYHQPSSDPSHPISNLHDQESPAWIGQRMLLDGVGGVSTLVRADVHRFGAVFPSWPVDNEVETEGLGVLSRKLGARVVGLPNYLVWHAS